MNISTENQHKTTIRRAGAVYGALALFGVGYNALTSWLEERGLEEGYTSDLVALGVLVTVVAVAPLVGIRRAAFVLGGFVASGAPMMIGARARYRGWRLREREYVNGTQAGMEPQARLHRGPQAR